MSKQFKVNLGGQERNLAFAFDDAEMLAREFPQDAKEKGLGGLVIEDVLGFAQVADPDLPSKKTYAFVNRFNPRARKVLLFLELQRANPREKITEQRVGTWLNEHLQAGGNLFEIAYAAACCAFYSGAITGHQYDLEAELGDAAGELGKGQTQQPPTVQAAE